jgi:chromosome segregation ATPase
MQDLERELAETTSSIEALQIRCDEQELRLASLQTQHGNDLAHIDTLSRDAAQQIEQLKALHASEIATLQARVSGRTTLSHTILGFGAEINLLVRTQSVEPWSKSLQSFSKARPPHSYVENP